jgi:phage shock protein C
LWEEAVGGIVSTMNTTTTPTTLPGRLTRSSTDRKIGGVAGGIAAHSGVDPLLVRIGFVVTTLFTGLGILAYLALLAFVPSDDDEAPAAAQPAAA